jgi:flagellar hook capping protein FlgD
MKSFYCVILMVLLLVSSLVGQTQDIALSFITVNGYSNNLYIDNLTVGTQFSSDIAVVSINNIDADTSYALGSSDVIISPNVTIINIGTADISSSFDITMSAAPGGYSSTKSVASLISGSGSDVIFDPITITPGTSIDITIFSMLPGDENTANDTLNQYTLIFPGVQRSNVIVQEWTSSTCGPCASNNPTIDAFVDANIDSVVPIKYHVWWPGAGNDPMYLHNEAQVRYRTGYYGVGGVPNLIMSGVNDPGFPYTTPANKLQNAFDVQITRGTPVEISVVDTPIPGDSIQADISITIHAPLKAGDYVLQVEAVERHIHYATAPGSNGETDFYDVFRRAYPDEFGTIMPTSIGTHNFSFKYAIDMAVWADSMIYTAAYVQDNATRDIWGSAKGNTIITTKNTDVVNNTYPLIANSKPMPLLDNTNFGGYSVMTEKLNDFNYELFEATFPPTGWRLVNPDDGITFEKYEGANGNLFGGNNSVLMDFVSYGTVGATDTLYTRVYTDIVNTDSIIFEYAHAEYPGYGPDRLIVKLSVDGGLTFPHTIFDKAGDVLATAPASSNTFVPTASQWAVFSTSIDDIVNSIPEETNIVRNFTLDQNYPNPFNPGTYISYNIPASSVVNLKIYNTLGQEIRTLVDNISQSTNPYKVYWNGKDDSGTEVSTGVYYYKIVTKNSNKIFEQSRKMLLIK